MYDCRICSYVCGRCCICNRSSRGIFYLIYCIGECGVRLHWRLFVTITSLLQSMEGTCHGHVCIVVLVMYLVLSVLALLVVCVATCVCVVVLVAHLVLSVLAALVVCVGYMYVLWCLERNWCCQCLLYLAYVLSMCVCCGAWSAPGAVSACCTWAYVLAICGA